MIDELVALGGALRLQHRLLKQSAQDQGVLRAVDAFLDSYCSFHRLSPREACAAITKFTQRYQEDVTLFAATGKYPRELGRGEFRLSRVEYDIFLIASMLFTRHRYSIALNLSRLDAPAGPAAFIGVGSGVELHLTARPSERTDAFDLSVSDFVRQSFPEVAFHEAPFTPGDEYGAVFAIELLEHLADPIALVREVHHALRSGGVFVCTTARNVPQFDHLSNPDAGEFETRLSGLFRLRSRERIPHDYRLADIGAENVLYVLEK